MDYNSRKRENAFAMSFKPDRISPVKCKKRSGIFISFGEQDFKQPESRQNVVFVPAGERPFRIKKPFRFPSMGQSLIKDNPSSQYQHTRTESNESVIRDYFDSRKQEYLQLLTSTDFYNGETEEIETMTNSFLKKRRSVYLNWIQQVFLDNIDNAAIEVGILNLMRLYTYDDLAPASQMIALASRDMTDDRVKDAAFSLFGHWGDERALKLLEAYETPSDPFLAMKYETLKNDIREYALCKGNR